MLATLFVVPCICHYFHVPVAIVKCVKICGFVTIYRGSPAKTLSHTPKMLYGKVLNNIAWGSLLKNNLQNSSLEDAILIKHQWSGAVPIMWLTN